MEQGATARTAEDDTTAANAWHPWFIASVVALGAAILVFAFVIVSLARDGGGTTDAAAPGGQPTQPAGGDATNEPSTATNTASTTASATQTRETTTATPSTGRLLTCGDILAPINKQNYLDAGCVPGDLEAIPAAMSRQGEQLMRADARTAFVALINAAAVDGFDLYAISAYRSYQGQVAAYNANLSGCGGDVACADRISAHPGHSEHQLGTTVDVSSESAGFGLESFIGTAEAGWVAENAWKHGFVVSYPDGKEQITGYSYEPWHIRYIGKDEAKKVRDSGLTLHEYLARR
ncbi:MAG: M15 family metallopeptidase [Dehalococcoidia bacterium]|nr:M15 family metallopeptidase [Dehalococcoidia bacterium]